MNLKQLHEQPNMEWNQEERRTEDRDTLKDSFRVFADHMHSIKRALDAGQINRARALVDGAIQAFEQHREYK